MSKCLRSGKTPAGIRPRETCEEADERKWIAYRLRRYSSAVRPQEREVVSLLFAVDGGRRSTVSEIADRLGSSRATITKLIREALRKIGWKKPIDLGQTDAV